jgi:hypothetical protein
VDRGRDAAHPAGLAGRGAAIPAVHRTTAAGTADRGGRTSMPAAASHENPGAAGAAPSAAPSADRREAGATAPAEPAAAIRVRPGASGGVRVPPAAGAGRETADRGAASCAGCGTARHAAAPAGGRSAAHRSLVAACAGPAAAGARQARAGAVPAVAWRTPVGGSRAPVNSGAGPARASVIRPRRGRRPVAGDSGGRLFPPASAGATGPDGSTTARRAVAQADRTPAAARRAVAGAADWLPAAAPAGLRGAGPAAPPGVRQGRGSDPGRTPSGPARRGALGGSGRVRMGADRAGRIPGDPAPSIWVRSDPPSPLVPSPPVHPRRGGIAAGCGHPRARRQPRTGDRWTQRSRRTGDRWIRRSRRTGDRPSRTTTAAVPAGDRPPHVPRRAGRGPDSPRRPGCARPGAAPGRPGNAGPAAVPTPR